MSQTGTESAVCAICGQRFPRSQLDQFCGQPVCRRCLSEQTFVCVCCKTRVARSEQADCGGALICQTCFDTHYTLCYSCGSLLSQERVHWRFLDGLERPLCLSCSDAISAITPGGSDPEE